MSDRFRSTLCLGVAMLLCLCGLAAAQPKVELLWPDGAPGAKGQAEGDKPTLTIYLPPADKATGAAIVICPGGGYGHLAMDHEGHQIGQWLNSFGVAGFIVAYRHRNSGAGYGHPAPIQDAQRAIRTVRSRAREWGVDPNRIGILGFSAGGHLASTAATHFNESFVEPRDAHRPRELPAGLRGAGLPGDLLHRALHAHRLADEPARGRRGQGAHREVLERKAGDAADAADVPVPHVGGHGRPGREQHRVLSGAAQGEGPGRDAHLPEGPARHRPGPEERRAPPPGRACARNGWRNPGSSKAKRRNDGKSVGQAPPYGCRPETASRGQCEA